MSSVMIATGVTRTLRIRHVSVGQLAWGATFAAVSLLTAGGLVGYQLGSGAAAGAPELAVAEPVSAPPSAAPPSAALPFALDQLGKISARMFSLENQAAQLGKRIGVAPAAIAASVPQAAPAAPAVPTTSPVRMAKADEAAPTAGTDHAAAVQGLKSVDAQLARIESKMALLADASAQRASLLMRLPTRAPIAGAALVSAFGNRTDPFAPGKAFHAGLDFAAALGTPIRSAAGGRVVFAGFRPDFGWLVEIEHGNGLKTRYAHASKLLVRAGMIVTPGELIAMVGSSGRSTGPHLHYEVLHRGEPLDPKRYLAGL